MLPFRHYMGDKRPSTCIEGCTENYKNGKYSSSERSDSGQGWCRGEERARKVELKMRIFRNTKAVEICSSRPNPLRFNKGSIVRAINSTESVNLDMTHFVFFCFFYGLTKCDCATRQIIFKLSDWTFELKKSSPEEYVMTTNLYFSEQPFSSKLFCSTPGFTICNNADHFYCHFHVDPACKCYRKHTLITKCDNVSAFGTRKPARVFSSL